VFKIVKIVFNRVLHLFLRDQFKRRILYIDRLSNVSSTFSCMTAFIAFALSHFLNDADKWCATVGINNYNQKVYLYSNDWTDHHHYICQYDCEYHIQGGPKK